VQSEPTGNHVHKRVVLMTRLMENDQYALLGRLMANFVAYFRVSTERQGKSGLGLAAQHRKISEFVAGAGSIIAEFCDIQSGRNDSRVELQKALQLAKRENAKIVNLHHG